jgi:hypothetical protein
MGFGCFGCWDCRLKSGQTGYKTVERLGPLQGQGDQRISSQRRPPGGVAEDGGLGLARAAWGARAACAQIRDAYRRRPSHTQTSSPSSRRWCHSFLSDPGGENGARRPPVVGRQPPGRGCQLPRGLDHGQVNGLCVFPRTPWGRCQPAVATFSVVERGAGERAVAKQAHWGASWIPKPSVERGGPWTRRRRGARPRRTPLGLNTPDPPLLDRTLPTSGSVCIDRFNALIKSQYKDDAACADLIKAALSSADPAKCPEGSRKPGSKVQKCMSKSPVSGGQGGAVAWGRRRGGQTVHRKGSPGAHAHTLPRPRAHTRPPALRGLTLCATVRS